MSESFYRDIAPWYDLEFDEFDADVDLYRGYADMVGSPILELGCGTGRLVIALSNAGYEVVGVDSSEAMLERARDRLRAAHIDNVALLRRDMRQLGDLEDGRFRLVFSAMNSFLHLENRVDQITTLQSASRVLHHRGILVLDVFHPSPATLQSMDDRLTLDASWDLPDGVHMDRFSHRRVHPAEQLIETTLIFDLSDANGIVTRKRTSYHTHYIHYHEMLGLLDVAGFVVESVYGSYSLEPFEDGSSSMIFVAHRR